MQLVDEGLLSLDTTVSEVLPGARLGTADIGGQVTVRHLLTHTSGIDGDIFTDTGRG
ncbi:MAG: serine hydrolase [Streptosporangiaceae bacterium]